MLAIAGGILIVVGVFIAFAIGAHIAGVGAEIEYRPMKGCGCLIMLAVVAFVVFVIF